jgi:peroxiredoxin Q/BCP
LLADEKKEAIKAYKTWGKKKFMGREFVGQIRSTFLIKDKKIINEWRNVKVKDHAKEVLNYLKYD